MSWINKFWTAYDYATSTVINSTAAALSTVGSLACKVGGAGFALSYAIDETVKGSYYGLANAVGKIDMGIDIIQFSYSINGTLPFQQSFQKEDGMSYHLKDYLRADVLRAASGIFSVSGLFLNVISANIKKWQQGRDDKKYIKNKYGKESTGATLKEHIYESAAIACSSLTDSFISCAITSSIINYSGLIGSNKSITYPYTSPWRINSTQYQGPVQSTLFPLSYKIEQNKTLNLPFIGQVDILQKVLGEALLNVTGGGGLFFKSNNKTSLPTAIPASLGITTHLTGSFFANKATRQRDNRMQPIHSVEYAPYEPV